MNLKDLGFTEEEIKNIKYVAELFHAQWVRLIEEIT
jgi:hypothetical protein